MQKHKTKRILIKGINRRRYANVDIGIISLIKWFNEHSGIETDFSCQGNKKFEAYVVFFCTDMVSLEKICNRLKSVFPHIFFVDPYNLKVMDTGLYCHRKLTGIRFSLNFRSVKIMEKFQDAVCKPQVLAYNFCKT